MCVLTPHNPVVPYLALLRLSLGLHQPTSQSISRKGRPMLTQGATWSDLKPWNRMIALYICLIVSFSVSPSQQAHANTYMHAHLHTGVLLVTYPNTIQRLCSECSFIFGLLCCGLLCIGYYSWPSPILLSFLVPVSMVSGLIAQLCWWDQPQFKSTLRLELCRN